MKIKMILPVFLLSSIFCWNAQADAQKERIYLLQLINQINAMKPLIIAASLQQPKTNRIQFHYVSYKDQHQKKHHGLIGDLNQIEMSIQNKLNHAPIEPSVLPPIQGDYITHGKNQGI